MSLKITQNTSPSRLASLKTNDTIRLGWRATPGAEPVILYDSFPKNVATSFSRLLNASFPPINQTPVANLRNAASKSFMIIGGHLEYHREVLEWMLTCCNGKGVQDFRFSPNHAFYHYAMVYSSACLLEVPYLQGHLKERLQRLASRQVHSEDVTLIFSDPVFSGPHPIKQLVCESIGHAIWEKRLAMRHVYEQLRRTDGFDEFDVGIGKVIEQLKADWKASPAYQDVLAQKQEKAAKNKQRHKEYLRRQEEREKLRAARSIARRHDVAESAVQLRKDGYTLNAQGRLVNRGKNGHHKRVAISLADLQITHRNYRTE